MKGSRPSESLAIDPFAERDDHFIQVSFAELVQVVAVHRKLHVDAEGNRRDVELRNLDKTPSQRFCLKLTS